MSLLHNISNQQLIDKIGVIVLALDADGRIDMINTAGCELLGFPEKELVGKEWIREFIPSQERQRVAELFTKIIAGQNGLQPCNQNNVIIRSGELRTINWQNTVLADKDGTIEGFLSTGQDITPKIRAEIEIRRSEERYRLLFEKAPVGILHYDTNLRVTESNENYMRLMEITRDQLIGYDINKLKDKRVLPALTKPLEGKEGWWEGAYRSTISNKTLYLSLRSAPLFDARGNIVGGMVIVVDRSRQKQDEAEKNLLLSAINQASEPIVITDTNGAMEYVNPAFEQVTGYTMQEVLGKHQNILSSGYHEESFFTSIWQELTQGLVWTGHITNKRKDGKIIEEDVTISPVRNHDGKITNFIEVKHDVTRKAALEKQLRHTTKMEAVGTMAGGIAHDFNNILSAILGYAEMAERQLPDNPRVRQDLQQIMIAGNRAADLVKQILSFSRKEEEEKKPIHIQTIIKEALKLIRSSLPTTITLKQTLDNTCGPVLADPVRIHQVLINLCTNAKQAMEERNGTLSVHLNEITLNSDEIEESILPLQKGKWVDLKVCDSGRGINPAICDKIFDPFFTTRKKTGGTGLGLSVVHGIVKSHGGEITVASEPGRGTTFHIYLPVIDQQPAGELAPVNPAYLPSGRGLIILVDDEPQLVDIQKRLLATLGYDVQAFTNSSEALRWFKDNRQNVDLVITDMTMPYLRGDELAKEVLALCPDLPVILCTGYSESMNKRQAKLLGIKEFITKPINNKQLAETIKTLLESSKK